MGNRINGASHSLTQSANNLCSVADANVSTSIKAQWSYYCVCLELQYKQDGEQGRKYDVDNDRLS